MSKKNRRVNPSQLGSAISDIIKEYTDDIVKAMPDIVKEVSKNTVKTLKKSAGAQFGGQKYKNSFRYKDLTIVKDKPNTVIYSAAPHYRVAHLLEHGHVIKNQTGIVYGTTQARPHWKPAEEAAVKDLEDKLVKKIKEG